MKGRLQGVWGQDYAVQCDFTEPEVTKTQQGLWNMAMIINS